MSEAAQNMLEKIEQAIVAVLTRGQDVTINGKRYTRANLADLKEMRRELRAEVVSSSRGGIRLRQGVSRG